MRKKLLLVLILAIGLSLRIYGLNWDQGHHLHPDERFLTMVGTAIDWPENIGEYFNTRKSPLNPRNNDFGFFVYGPLPIFLTKAVSQIFGFHDYAHFNLVGRVLAALADGGVIILLYLISKKVWPSLLYSLMVLPIQLSHFFAVDPFLNFFLVLSFYAALNLSPLFVGLFMGMALSCKITAVLFLPIIGLVFLKRYSGNFKKLLLFTVYLLLITSATARIFNPYSFVGLFQPNPEFIADIKELNSFGGKDTGYPPGIQWIKTKPLIFPAKNIFFWGLGVPLGIVTIIAIFSVILSMTKEPPGILQPLKWLQNDNMIVYLIWIFMLFIFQGVQFSKNMRYFLPVYPFMALIAGGWLASRSKKSKAIIISNLFIYPLMFMAIYSQPHSRVKASKWIYENIPAGSTISCEHWDDCLPLPLNGKNSSRYEQLTLELFGADTDRKWQKMNQQLEKIDYIILSSSRLYGSIPTVPERYPRTTRFYQQLFAGELSPPSGQGTFKEVAEITSYPSFFGIELNDDPSEEAFTVYDHPKVIIFEKR